MSTTTPLITPRYVNDGMEVYVRLREAPGGVIWCRGKVAVAAGNHARVISVERGIDRWYALDDLKVKSPFQLVNSVSSDPVPPTT